MMEILQPKYDGWYAEGIVTKDKMRLVSSSSAELTTFNIPDIRYFEEGQIYRLRGEYIYGTNRALKSTDYMTYRVYDIIAEGSYRDRYHLLTEWVTNYHTWCRDMHKEPQIFLTPNLPPDSFSYLLEEVKAGRLEGVIGRNWNAQMNDKVFRFKPVFCTDYILIGLEEGRGRLENMTGAFVGGQFKDGKITTICRVSGMTDSLRQDTWQKKQKYLGHVFEAEGSQVFDSGALRHPRFKRWRLDVNPTEVTWKGNNGRYSE